MHFGVWLFPFEISGQADCLAENRCRDGLFISRQFPPYAIGERYKNRSSCGERPIPVLIRAAAVHELWSLVKRRSEQYVHYTFAGYKRPYLKRVHPPSGE